MKGFIEALQLMLRNRARRKLFDEYNRNALRNKRILAQLGIIEAGRELAQQTEGILNYWPAAARSRHRRKARAAARLRKTSGI